MADSLGVPIQFFFDDMPITTKNKEFEGLAEGGAPDQLMDFLNSNEGFQLSRAFCVIQDPNVRKKVLDLVKALATPD